MSAVSTAPALEKALGVNGQLFDAIFNATESGIQMAGSNCKCVSVSKAPGQHGGEVTGLIGVHGAVSGFISLNTAESLALHLVGGLLDECYTKLTPQVIDGVGEVTNIVAGGIKSQLAGTDWGFNQLTVPSMIVGNGYQVAFGRGLELIDVAFEVDNPDAIRLSDRMLHVTLSLLKLA